MFKWRKDNEVWMSEENLGEDFVKAYNDMAVEKMKLFGRYKILTKCS